MKQNEGIVTPPNKFHNGDRVMLKPGIRHIMAGRAGTVGVVRGIGHGEACYVVFDLGGGAFDMDWFYATDLCNMLYNPDGDGFYRVKDIKDERMTVAERRTYQSGRVCWEVLGDVNCYTDEDFPTKFVLYEKLAIGG